MTTSASREVHDLDRMMTMIRHISAPRFLHLKDLPASDRLGMAWQDGVEVPLVCATTVGPECAGFCGCGSYLLVRQ